MQAEESCTVALGQQKSTKAYWRRAKARKMMNRFEEAEQGELGLCPTIRIVALTAVGKIYEQY